MSQSSLDDRRPCPGRLSTSNWQRPPRASSAALFWLALGCSASATNSPLLQQMSDGGASSSGGSGSEAGGDIATGGSSAAGGSAASSSGGVSGSLGSAGVPSPSSGGGAVSHAGAGGTTNSNSGGSPATSGTGGTCNSTGPNGEAFYDDFEDGEYMNCPEWIDADPTLGGKWSVKDDGGTKVLAQTATVSDLVFVVSGDYRLTDQTVTAKVKFTSSPGIVAIFARVQDARNFYYLYLDGSNLVLRGKVNNSSLTSVKAKTPSVEGTWYTLKLSVVGGTLTGYLNGTMLVTTTDSSIKSGGVGVGTGDSASAEFDDVTVTSP